MRPAAPLHSPGGHPHPLRACAPFVQVTGGILGTSRRRTTLRDRTAALPRPDSAQLHHRPRAGGSARDPDPGAGRTSGDKINRPPGTLLPS